MKSDSPPHLRARVDALPAEIKKDVPADEAEKIKKSLTDAGATVEFK